ncbi:hypothetical protein ACFRDV_38845 [Streptomyces fagopyri]|uniref:hypothetical protein n=1 Tax=Streptomyces fagopyri TaxID=2662397 RepID=UPI00367C3516
MIPDMGYELHMTRASDVMNSDECPITFEEWLAFAQDCPVLREDGYLDLVGIGRQALFTWISPGGSAVGFHWYEGRVTLSGAHAPGVDRTPLADFAAELSANLIGDDDEHYTGGLGAGGAEHRAWEAEAV